MGPGRTIALVGQPNVGKSALLSCLTGVKAVISNYPGTTVEVLEGDFYLGDEKLHVIDTPGTYTLHSDTEEQRVTQRILIEAAIDLVVNVLDAANLDRNLYLTLQLLDFGLPMVIALNQIDRARSLGISIDSEKLSRLFGVPVVPISVTRGEGFSELKTAIRETKTGGRPMEFSGLVEQSIEILAEEIEKKAVLEGAPHHSARTLAIHLLEHDRLDEYMLKAYPRLEPVIEDLQERMGKRNPLCPNCFRDCSFCPAAGEHPVFLTCLERTETARRIARDVVKVAPHHDNTLAERIEGVIDRPATGIPFLTILLYLTFRLIMLAIDGSEQGIELLATALGNWHLVEIPEGPVAGLLARSFSEGVITPFGVVMPAMVSVYTVIALLEDTGLLARTAVILDRLTRVISLPGYSLIPLLLGFGCRAPAVLATRILGDNKERFMVITLLSIVVPCSASLGIISAVVAKFDASAPVIVLSMLVVFAALSIFLGRFVKGQNLDLVLEVPPLRLPILKNVLGKTWMRLSGFFTQVLPLMLIASIVIRLLLDAGVFQLLGQVSAVTLLLFGIHGEAFVGVIITVVQRYLAPIVLLNLPLSAREATIASAMVALSFPCLPVSVLAYRELGAKSLLKILAIAGLIPIVVGLILNAMLP